MFFIIQMVEILNHLIVITNLRLFGGEIKQVVLKRQTGEYEFSWPHDLKPPLMSL